MARVEMRSVVTVLLSASGSYGERDGSPSQSRQWHELDEGTVKAA
jgi:hypothetical protein